MRPLQICTNCVMDTTDSKIVFDDNGRCDHCNSFYRDILPNWHTDERGRRELMAEVEKIKAAGKGRDFDCIIGMSGGIDSSYLTYIAKEELGLRPLVFHVDAGWNSQEAVNNIERLVDKLGLDLYTEVIDWEEMRDLQLAYFKAGVPHIDTPQDHAFFATMYKFAEQHDIKHILTGANLSTECIRNPIEWMYYQSDAIQLKDIHSRFGTRPLTTFPTTVDPAPQDLPTLRQGHPRRAAAQPRSIRQGQGDRAAGRQVRLAAVPAEALRVALHALLRGLLAARQVRLRHAQGAVLEPDRHRPDDARPRARAAQDAAARRRHDQARVDLRRDQARHQRAELQGYLDAPNKTYKRLQVAGDIIYAAGAKVMRMLGLELGGKR